MSIYLLSGKDLYREEKSLKDILKKTGADRDHTIVFDASDPKTFRFESAILECDTFSLFEGSDRKAVIIKDPHFLNAGSSSGSKKVSKKKENVMEAEKERRISLLEQYLKRPNPDTALIFYCHGFDADSRKKEYKMIQKAGGIITEYKKMYDRDFGVYADNELRACGISLTRQARTELLARVSCDSLLLHNAIDKLQLYGQKEYGIDEVRNLVSINPEVNVFNMSNQFLRGDLAGTLQSADEMLKQSFDYGNLLSMLSARIRAIYCMRKLYETGLREDEIAIRLRQKPYAVRKGLENTSSVSSKRLLQMLNELAELDQGIKSGNVPPKEGFERFILKNGKYHAGY